MTQPIEYRQPIYHRNGKFHEWHIWGVGIENTDMSYATAWVSASDPKITHAFLSQQWIGLKDRKGQKVYVGDIVKLPLGAICFIVFKNGQFQFESILNVAERRPIHEFDIINSEVIDNIIENKLQLLK